MMHRVYKMKTCPRCGAEYRPGGSKQKYCLACRPLVDRERGRAWRIANPERDAEDKRLWHLSHPRIVDKTRICVRCGGEYQAKANNQKYCPICQPIMNLEWNRKGVAKWEATHPEAAAMSHHKRETRHYELHRDECIASVRSWQKRNPEKVKITMAKNHAKRRVLGLVPMNLPFSGSEGHHIDEERVIYIPSSLHKSISHCVWTGKNMAKINAEAFNFLFKQEVTHALA